MDSTSDSAARDGWARLRFAIIGPLLAAPPPRGRLRAALERLAAQEWQHPRGGMTRFSLSTIERWYYQALAESDDPVAALRRRSRADAGRERRLSAPFIAAMRAQHEAHPSWTMALHHGNLAKQVERDPGLGPMPSYATLRRAMRRRGLAPRRAAGAVAGGCGPREVLSYEMSLSHALWHCDFHHTDLRVLMPNGEWRSPILFGAIDDHSRFICHLQWYLSETAEAFTHGLCQAFMKCGLPRSMMSDNGAPMMAREVRAGLHRLSVVHETTRVRSPHQNGKIEKMWDAIEGRLMAMIRDCATTPDLDALNDMTLAWVNHDYHRRVHRGIGVTPRQRLLASESAGRDCPRVEALRSAFRIRAKRKLRRSDGTLTLNGVRFQLPKQWRHLQEAWLRYARWDLTVVELITEAGDRIALIHPLDVRQNARAKRRPVGGDAASVSADAARRKGAADGQGRDAEPSLPPLLEDIMRKQAQSGVPAPWTPFDDDAAASARPESSEAAADADAIPSHAGGDDETGRS